MEKTSKLTLQTQNSRILVGNYVTFRISFRVPSFLMLGTGVEEFLEGCQVFLPCDIALSKLLLIHDGGVKVLNKFLPQMLPKC